MIQFNTRVKVFVSIDGEENVYFGRIQHNYDGAGSVTLGLSRGRIAIIPEFRIIRVETNSELQGA